MKIVSLGIINIGLIEKELIEFNAPLNIFYGNIRQGKTTILKAIKLCFGGSFSQDLLTHGKDEGSVCLQFDNASINRSFYRNDTGETKARPIELIIDGKLQKKPSDVIKTFLNPFLLDQDYFSNMNEPDRKKFFADIFDINTEELDNKLSESSRKATSFRSEIKGFGEIDVTKVEFLDVEPLERELSEIDERNDIVYHEATAKNAEVKENNDKITRAFDTFSEIETQLAQLKERHKTALAWLKDNPKKELLPEPTLENTEELQRKINGASAQNVRHEQYEKNLARQSEKEAKQKELKTIEHDQRNIKTIKSGKLQEVSKTCGIPGLLFTEEGDFTFEETASSMLSTSQEMNLSQLLSGLYPEGFKLSLIDRGESLGSSIFDLIEQATKTESTTLVTVVGKKPSEVPENVGVFVVKGGKITQNKE